MIRPRVQEGDLDLVLSSVLGDAQHEANGQWGDGGPSQEVLRVIHACRRIRVSMRRSVAGVRGYEMAKARGNLPPVLTRIVGYSMGEDGRVRPGDDGRPVYAFVRRS